MKTTESGVLALEVDQVVKTYGQVQALKGVSFGVQPGEVFGLLGPNGAGKTSLISIVVTLEKATSGGVRVFGHDVATQPRLAKARTGWVPQEIINHGFFSVKEILRFHAGYYGVKSPQARIDYLLQSLGLWEHREKKVKQLSGGMKRRLMIAKALVHKPGLLLLDEPTAGVDVELRTRLWDFVEELRREGVSVLLTTHYLEEAERLCDRVAILHSGLIRAMGPTADLIAQYSRKTVGLRLLGERPVANHPELIRAEGRLWEFLIPMGKPIGQLIQELQIPIGELADLQVTDGRLEDVFLQLTSAQGVSPQVGLGK